MNIYLRVTGLGFVAGVLALTTIVLGIYLALALFAISFTWVEALAQARTAGSAAPVWALLFQSLVASGENALRGLWALRGAFLVFGGLGVVSAWTYQVGLWLNPRRAGWISFLCVAAMISCAVIAWLYAQRDQITLWMSESPETYRWRDVLLGSQTASLSVGPIFALAVAYPTWALWRWWYLRLTDRHVLAQTAPVARTAATASDHRRYIERLSALKRGVPTEPVPGTVFPSAPAAQSNAPQVTLLVQSNGVLAALLLLTLVTTAGYLAVSRAHAQVALRLVHGTVFVDASNQPHADFRLEIAADVHRLRIVNINGLGKVSLTFRPASAPEQAVSQVPDWEFEWRADDYLYQDLPVRDLIPGDYILRFDQAEGWGYFEYMLSQGNPQASQMLALTAGLLLATSLLFAVAVIAIGWQRLVQS